MTVVLGYKRGTGQCMNQDKQQKGCREGIVNGCVLNVELMGTRLPRYNRKRQKQ